MKKQVITHEINGAPTSSDTISAGYNIGQWWRDTATGKIYYHKTDGVWVDVTSGGGGAVNSVNGQTGTVELDYADVGAQEALGFTPENSANKGEANGYAGLDADSKISLANTPIGKILSDVTYEPAWISGATYDSATQTFTLNAHGLVNGDIVSFRDNTGVVPENVQQYNVDEKGGQYYNVINKTDNTFQITDTVGGSTPFVTASNGTSGWQFRKAPDYYDIALPNLGTAKNIKATFIIWYGKKTTNNVLLQGIINNQKNAVYINGSTDNFLSRLYLTNSNVLSKYSMLVINVELKRVSESSVICKMTSSTKHSSDKTTWISNPQLGGTSDQVITGLKEEVTSIRFNASVPTNAVPRTIRAIIYQQ